MRFYDRVKETTSSTGTGDLVLAGATPGYRAFSDVMTDGQDTVVVISNRTKPSEWEITQATFGDAGTGTLARGRLVQSSTGSRVNFSAGRKDVFIGEVAPLLPSTISVGLFGAKGDGLTDDTAAIQACIDHVRTLDGGGTICFPPGEFLVSASLDLSTPTSVFTQQIMLEGAGPYVTKISPTVAGLVVVDMIGANYAQLRNLSIESGRVVSQCGILLARSATANNCNKNQFHNVLVNGNYSLASVVSIAAESTTWFGCRLENNHGPANHRMLWTGTTNQVGVVSAYGEPQTSSNTDNRMIACEFYAPQNNAHHVVFWAGAGYRFTDCTSIGGGTNNRLFTFVQNGSFEGPVEFYGHHWESYGDGNAVALYLDCQGVAAQFRNINVFGGGYFSNSGSFIDFDRTDRTNQPVLFEGTITTVKGQSSGQPPLSIHAFAVHGCNITWLEQEATGTVVVLGYVLGSTIKASEYRAPCAAVQFQYSSALDAEPTTGTQQKGQITYNCSPSAGDASGWLCTSAGTLGTLNDGDTTGTISSPLNVLEVNDATGLEPGMLIDVAGGSGPYIVWHVDGTTVTLGSNGSAVVGGAVSYYAPTLRALDEISGAIDTGWVNIRSPLAAGPTAGDGLHDEMPYWAGLDPDTNYEVPPGNYHFDLDISIEVRGLRLAPGAIISPASGKTVFLNVKNLEVGTQQYAFDLSRGGNVIIISGTITVYPEWWGAVGELPTTVPTVDDSDAFNAAALSAATLSGGKVGLHRRSYLIQNLAIPNNGIHWVGPARNGAFLHVPSGEAAFLVPNVLRQDCVWSDFTIVGETEGEGRGFDFLTSSAVLASCRWDRVTYQNLEYSFNHETGGFYSNQLSYQNFDNAPVFISSGAGCNANVWTHCRWANTRSDTPAFTGTATGGINVGNELAHPIFQSNNERCLLLADSLNFTVSGAAYFEGNNLDENDLPWIDIQQAASYNTVAYKIFEMSEAYYTSSVDSDQTIVGSSDAGVVYSDIRARFAHPAAGTDTLVDYSALANANKYRALGRSLIDVDLVTADSSTDFKLGESGDTGLLKIRRLVRHEGTPTYATNAAAISGGLSVGDQYVTSAGVLMLVI